MKKNAQVTLSCLLFLCFYTIGTEASYAQGQPENKVERKKKISRKQAGATQRATYSGSARPQDKNIKQVMDDDRGSFSGVTPYVDRRKFLANKENQRAKHAGKISAKKLEHQRADNIAKGDERADHSGKERYVDMRKKYKKDNQPTTGYAGKISARKLEHQRADNLAREDERADYTGNVRYVNMRKKYKKDNETTTGYAGKISARKLEKSRADNMARDDERADYTGNVRYVDMRKKYKKDNEKTTGYAGKISVRKLEKFRADNIARDDERADYSGNVRYVNMRKAYAKSGKELASYSGKISVKKLNRFKREMDNKDYSMANHSGNIRVKLRLIKHPYSETIHRRSGIANKTINTKYNSKAFFARRVGKDQLANYQKEGPRKLKHTRRETEMWQTGSIAKRDADGKITTTKMRPNSRDDQRKELLQKSKAERRAARKKGPKEERTGESIQNQPSEPPTGEH
jgi:hypothetical protein